MSTFIRKNSKDGIYDYDFQLAGQRYTGSTGATRKREADAVEAEIKAAEKKRLSEQPKWASGERITVEQACERWWEQKKLDWAPTTHASVLGILAWLVEHFGSAMLDEIDDNDIAKMVAKRRGERVPKRPDDLVKNGTVNQTTAALKRVMRRAVEVWKLPLKPINWSQHWLKKPQERVREASIGEESALLENARRGYEDVVRFSIRVGVRKTEALSLKWTQVDFFSNRISIFGKGAKTRVVPMTSDVRDLLWSLKDNHPVFVFTYVAFSTRTVKTKAGPKKLVRGQRYPMTVSSFNDAWQRIRANAKVSDFRFHDTRHTAATRLLRDSGNLRLVQKLLGHANIETTTKYAHSMVDDLAKAMEQMVSGETVSRDRSPAKSPAKLRRIAAND